MRSVLIFASVMLAARSYSSAQPLQIGSSRTCSLGSLTSTELLSGGPKTTSLRLASVDDGLRQLVAKMQDSQTLRLRSDQATVVGDAGKAVIVLDLTDPQNPEAKYYGYYIERTREFILLHGRVNDKGKVELRYWSGGDAELLITEEKGVLQPLSAGLARTLSDFRTVNNGEGDLSVSQTLQCLIRGLGLNVDASSVGNLLLSVTCSAPNAYSLIKTLAHCFSAFSAGTATVISTVFCTVGGAIDIGCNLVGCTEEPPPPVTSNCTISVPSNVTTRGEWTSACTSYHRRGSYAKSFSFNVATRSRVRIALHSPDVDNYLILVGGLWPNGTLIEENDDTVGNQARIDRTLDPGIYTVEATTYLQQVTGEFSLVISTDAISAPPPNPPPTTGRGNCQNSLNLDVQRVPADLTPSCPSTRGPGHYAYFHSFSLAERTSIQIDVESTAFDTYIYLHRGDNAGPVIAENDDGGVDLNSRISLVLERGTYTIEITSYAPQGTGRFFTSIVRR